MESTTTQVVELKQVSKNVYTAAPVQPYAMQNENGPRVILIFGWMDAQVSHTIKYMDSYAKLYPHASQILVRSRQSYFWSGRKAKEASLAPAIDLLRKEGVFQPSAPSILVHIFSNGGAFQLFELSRMLKSSDLPSGRPSAAVLIFDSVPGKMDLSTSLSAFLAPVRSTLARIVITIPLTIIYCVLFTIMSITRKRPLFDEMRDELNRAQVLPWTNAKTPRLYIYSDTDELVRHDAVAEHITQAKVLGLNVRAEYFKGSQHVAHARKDQDRYWAAVKQVWADATTS